jgi:hypothetical protein
MPCNFLGFRLYQLHAAVTNPGFNTIDNTINIPSAEALSHDSFLVFCVTAVKIHKNFTSSNLVERKNKNTGNPNQNRTFSASILLFVSAFQIESLFPAKFRR